MNTGTGAGDALFKPLIDLFQDILDFVSGPMAVAVILILLVFAVLLFVAGSRFEGAAGYFLRALAGAVFIANLAIIAKAIGLI
ncbi:hypothetical protein OAS86_02195 [Gammaproteobacteria bacterium]|nr:hypothetical protein [Gammaproteobacteria bacterium]